MVTLKAMLVHASEDLRGETAGKTQKMIACHCAGLCPRGLNTPEDANRHALRSIAKRWIALNDEIIELEAMIKDLVAQRASHLLERFGIGVDTAAEILIVAGDNPERIKSEAAFAKLAGISPIPAGSGMTSGKHRINQGGHRQLNAAIYRTVIARMRFHEPTIAYVARRTAEGKSKRDIISCLKRYVIREVYHLVKTDPAPARSAVDNYRSINAAAEAFFSSLEWEVLSRHDFANTRQAQAVVLDWCYGFYNHERRHSSAGMMSPVNYENTAAPDQEAA